MEDTSLRIRLFLDLLLLVSALDRNQVQGDDPVYPKILPNRLQFFTYEVIRLNCDGWRVMKNTTQWEKSETTMTITPALPSHSGEYWCESREGEKSESLNIAVTAGSVILESPVYPVIEGQTVTLGCRKKAPPHYQTADFYKNGKFKKTEFKGKMVVHNVSKSDEGVYKCRISGAGESLESRLAVKGSSVESSPLTPENTTFSETPPPPSPLPPPSPPPPPLHLGSVQLFILLPALFSSVFVALLFLLVGLLKCRKHKGCEKTTEGDVTYAAITIKKGKSRVEERFELDSNTATYAAVRPQRKTRGGRQESLVMSLETAYE
ncbi:low affinity immunoglobulin gamma Fc region receptor II-like [Xyrichtys novacula]|nr:low affinity immunoglobulin gamma Fc region receptor II-like [Xyrichtys novacula]